MVTKKHWAQQVMLGLFKKESAYNGGVTMNGTNACSMKGHETEVAWEDKIADDKGEVTGYEFGTDQEIIEPRVSLTYKEPKAKPNSLIGLAALAFGSVTSTQDGALAAYKHKITPVAVGTALPSTQAEEKHGGVQYTYKGMKANTLKIAANRADGLVTIEAGLMGSGNRATSATAFAAAISESWLKMRGCKVFMEDGSDISIAAPLSQGTQNISGVTPADLGVRLRSFDFGWNNNLVGQEGNDGTGEYVDIDYGKRTAELTFTLLFDSTTEMDHYLNQNPLAVELDMKGALIAATGTMYYGFQLIVPRFKLKSVPMPKADGDILVCEMVCDIQDDGTNPPVIIEGYNAQAAYLAA